MRNLSLMVLFISIIHWSCLEDFDLQFNQENDARMVVDGLITNEPGPYFVRLTYSSNTLNKEYNESEIWDHEKPVLDALVILSDDYGQVDTLLPIDTNGYIRDNSIGYYKLIFDSVNQEYDTLFLNHPIEYCHERGFYKTTSIIGIPNRTYKLSIYTGATEYVAYDYMAEVPDIDSLQVINEPGAEGKYDQAVPKVYFKEPKDQENYYLFQILDDIGEYHRFWIANRIWRYSVLADEYLEPYVNGLKVDDGISPDGIEFYPAYFTGQVVKISMSSISENAYNYFSCLAQQMETDGGAFKPAPASPPTNISNGGLGFFRASAVKYYQKDIIIN